MSTNDVPSVLDDDDTFNLAGAEHTKPFYDLEPFAQEFAPQYWRVIDRVLRHEDVKAKDMQSIMRVLVDELVPYYDSNGTITDPKMAHLHETLVQVGRQL